MKKKALLLKTLRHDSVAVSGAAVVEIGGGYGLCVCVCVICVVGGESSKYLP